MFRNLDVYLQLTVPQKQYAIAQAASQEYSHARTKQSRNTPQGGKKLAAEISFHYQKRILTQARRDFDELFETATSMQDKMLAYHILHSPIVFH